MSWRNFARSRNWKQGEMYMEKPDDFKSIYMSLFLCLSFSLYLTFNIDDEMEAEKTRLPASNDQQSLLLEVGKVCRWKSGISKSMEWPRTTVYTRPT